MTKETAMKILKELHGKSLFAERTALETIFPELKENERIKNVFIGFVESYLFWEKDGLTKEKALAWLEKQGSSSVKWQKNTPENKPPKNHSVLMKTVDGIAEGEWDGKYWHQYRWSTHIYDSNVLYWIELHDLDEQGEQKPTSNVRYEVWAGGSLSVNGKPFDYEDATITQKDFAPQQEPKLKVGDWIVDIEDKEVFMISKDLDNTFRTNVYRIISTEGEEFDIHKYTIEDNYRLWDITKDAKDGDVLACGDKVTDCPFIFHNLTEELNPRSYCGVNKLRHFQDNDENGGSWCYSDEVRPATKEQRDLLFQKMKEAGYEWDAEKKELKKIEESYYIPKGCYIEVRDGYIAIKKSNDKK